MVHAVDHRLPSFEHASVRETDSSSGDESFKGRNYIRSLIAAQKESIRI